MYITSQEQINNIFGCYNDFQCYSFKGYTLIDPAIDFGDIIVIDEKPVIFQGNLEFFGKMRADISSTIKSKNKENTMTRKVSQTTINRRVQSEIDQENLKIQQLISSNTDLVQKTTSLKLDIDEIKGEIGTIADVTTTAEGYGNITAENINESEPILLKVYPTIEDITPLRPHIGLQPHIGLRPHRREIIFERINESEYDEHFKLEYNIPNDLYRLGNIYDEFILDYENEECYIQHRIGIDENGNKYVLDIEEKEIIEYPTIHLLDGDYRIYTPAFDSPYIYVRLMVKNLYTTQFTTKVEFKTSIRQTNNTIELLAYEKVGKDEIVSSINQSPEEIKIQANKLSLAGKLLDMTVDNITINSDNFKVDKYGNIQANNAKLTGTFEQLSSTGKRAIYIANNTINIYDWDRNFELAGKLGATYNVTQISGDPVTNIGVDFYGEYSNYIGLGILNNNKVTEAIKVDNRILNGHTPYIRNTVSGTLFGNNGSGIEIEHGLIKNWSLYGVTGIYFPQAGGIEIKDGLITNWNLETTTATLDNVTIVGIDVRNGLIRSIRYKQN